MSNQRVFLVLPDGKTMDVTDLKVRFGSSGRTFSMSQLVPPPQSQEIHEDKHSSGLSEGEVMMLENSESERRNRWDDPQNDH
jgi:hypothetical protein